VIYEEIKQAVHTVRQHLYWAVNNTLLRIMLWVYQMISCTHFWWVATFYCAHVRNSSCLHIAKHTLVIHGKD